MAKSKSYQLVGIEDSSDECNIVKVKANNVAKTIDKEKKAKRVGERLF